MMTLRFVFLTLIGITACSCAFANEPDEKLLLGFEPDEFERLPAELKRQVADARDVERQPYKDVRLPWGRSERKWQLYKGTATQGDYAVGLRYARKPNIQPIYGWSYRPTADFANRDAVIHYFSMFTDAHALFSTSGLHHLVMPADWSGYDLLRMDVRSEDLTLEYQVSFEDEDILPPIVRTMQGPPDKWVTLEVDLRAAAKARGVDLTKITSLSVGVTDFVDGTPKFGNDPKKRVALCFAKLDNIRLSRRDAAAKHPVIRDDSTYALLPDYYLPATKPQPKRVTQGKPDRSPVKLGEPIEIDTGGRALQTSRFNFVSAYDNNHLLVGFNTSNYWGTRALQTFDGGKTWRGVDGDLEKIGHADDEKEGGPTPLRMMDFIDGGGWGEVIDSYGDALVVTFGDGCGGPAAYHPRVFTRKLTFEGPGKGWMTRKFRALVDCEPRHCVASQSSFRDNSGRIWLAYGNLSRLNRSCISLRYSDDDALSWRPLHEGSAGRIPGSMADSLGGPGAYTYGEYTKQDPAPQLVPLGNGVACF